MTVLLLWGWDDAVLLTFASPHRLGSCQADTWHKHSCHNLFLWPSLHGFFPEAVSLPFTFSVSLFTDELYSCLSKVYVSKPPSLSSSHVQTLKTNSCFKCSGKGWFSFLTLLGSLVIHYLLMRRAYCIKGSGHSQISFSDIFPYLPF